MGDAVRWKMLCGCAGCVQLLSAGNREEGNLRRVLVSIVGSLMLLAGSMSVGSSMAAAQSSLTRSEVLSVLNSSYEMSGSSRTGEHLGLSGKIVTVSDGHGGTITAVPAVRFPTADGYGQLIVFWHNNQLIGSQSLTRLPLLGYEATMVAIYHSGPNSITLKFTRYKPSDPTCCPTLSPGYVTYHWSGKSLVASAPVPSGVGNGMRMMYVPKRPAELGRAAVLRVLAQAAEVQTKSEHLALDGKIVTVSDGHGGTISAVPVHRSPTADGYGQYVLFWHNTTFIGSDNLTPLPALGTESSQVSVSLSGTNRIVVRFVRYRPSDPMCCPSLPPGYVTYHWTGTALSASAAIPTGSGDGLSMRLP